MSEIIDIAGKTLEVVPELYEDGLQSTVQETGKALTLIPQTINAALVPLRKWIAAREYSFAETQKLLANKLEHVSEDRIETPDAFVAVPALQAISYSMDSEELRNLYANLLANSMIKDAKGKVHPSFVEIIKQMSPNDASIFKIIYEAELTPLIDLSIENSEELGGGSNHHILNISWITHFPYEEVLLSIESLIHLGLIDIPYGISYVHKENYKLVTSTLDYQRKRKGLEALKTGVVRDEEKYIRKTALADAFYSVCIAPIE